MTAVSETAKAPGNTASGQVREITVAHSPDSDDAFMFYGLATNKVRTPGLRFSHTLCDIETLNQKAREGVYDVSAISFHAYPYVQDKYALMACGGSVGEGYGPMIVSPRPFTASEVKTKRIAVPGTLTTAFLALNCSLPESKPKSFPSTKSSPRCSKASSKRDSSFTKANSPTTNLDCIASSISAAGGRRSPACRYRWAATRSAAPSVQN